MKTYTADQLRAELRKRIETEFGGKPSAAALAWGVNRGNLSRVMRGEIGPFPQLLAGTGYKWVLIKS